MAWQLGNRFLTLITFFIVALQFAAPAQAGLITQAKPGDPTCDELLLKMGQDEGMWLVNRAPIDRLAATYDFKPNEQWLQKVMRASLKIGGGSGSFVSSNGLLMTNHHVTRDTLQKLSTSDRDLLKTGFVAQTREQELKAPDLEVKQLLEIADVTNQVLEGIRPEMSDAEQQILKRANSAKIEQQAKLESGLTSEVVELFLGAEYHLYKYKIHKDVRVVFAPEHAVAAFGGDELNFEYPRFSLDVAFLRVYGEDGKPLKTEDFFKWSKSGPQANELVFVTGHPGATNRLYTVAAMEYARDVQIPYTLNVLKRRIELLTKFSEISPENKRQAQSELLGLQNSFKVLSGDERGLASEEMFALKKTEEELLRRHISKTDQFKYLDQAWDTVVESTRVARSDFLRRVLISGGDAFSTKLFQYARTLVRMAAEDKKANTDRLPEYRDGRRDSLNISLFSNAPTYKEFELYKLRDSLAMMLQRLGPNDRMVKLILDGQSPQDRALALMSGTQLQNSEVRRELAAGGNEAINASKDPMIRLALMIDKEARRLRKRFEQKVETPSQRAYQQIARARYSLFGNQEYPDATGTLRIAFGRVLGYEANGKNVPAWTNVKAVYALQDDSDPSYRLPDSWQGDIDWGTKHIPYNFVSTADTIGGNSGSPVVNGDLEIVGINFDSNVYKIERQRYMYTDGRSRHISVHSAGIVEILRRVYRADHIVNELGK